MFLLSRSQVIGDEPYHSHTGRLQPAGVSAQRAAPPEGRSTRRMPAATLVIASGVPTAAADYPQIELKNNQLKLIVYLPDPEKGFYRGTRFDWSGVLGQVDFAGHKLFGPWKDKHDPTNYDDIIGPVEEFG